MWSDSEIKELLYSYVQFLTKGGTDITTFAKELSGLMGKTKNQIVNLMVVSNYDTMDIDELTNEYNSYRESNMEETYVVGKRVTIDYIHGSIKHTATGVVEKEYDHFYLLHMDGGYKTCVNK